MAQAPVKAPATKPLDPKAVKKAEREAEKAKRKAEREAMKANRKAMRGEGAELFASVDACNYDPKLHLPPKKDDFKHEYDFLEWKARQADKSAAKFRREAEECKTLGSSTQRAASRRLKKIREEMARLEAGLKAEGVDVEKFLASLK